MLIGPDAHHVFERTDENFAIADTTGASLACDGVDHLLDLVIAHHHFDFHLGHEIGDVLSAAVEFGVTLLAPDASDLVYGQPEHAHSLKLALHHIKGKGLDHSLDFLHQRCTLLHAARPISICNEQVSCFTVSARNQCGIALLCALGGHLLPSKAERSQSGPKCC